MSNFYRLICRHSHNVALYYMIRDSSMAINDWRIYPRLAAVIYPHTHALTYGRRCHSRSRAQSYVSVGLVWSFGTIIKPRMNVFDCRQQIKGIRRRCNQFTAAVIRCGGIFQSCRVMSTHEA